MKLTDAERAAFLAVMTKAQTAALALPDGKRPVAFTASMCAMITNAVADLTREALALSKNHTDARVAALEARIAELEARR